jgi:hypothetical protein
MIDGVLILTGTLFIIWLAPLFFQNETGAFPLTYFYIYYFISTSTIKVVAQKKYILRILGSGLILFFILILANTLLVSPFLQSYSLVLEILDSVLLIGVVLYYFLNDILSGLIKRA